MKTFITILFCFALVNAATLSAQFAPQVGISGTTAISKDESAIVAWAEACVLSRGWQNIADTSLGLVNVGDEYSAQGMADGNIVSLGDGGSATLTFAHAVYNGPGADFAVFENGFNAGGAGMAFLEFAFVEVSSDGVNFVRFPAHSHVQDTAQMPMDPIDCAQVHNLAGKYIFGYGTPFDLQDVAFSSAVNISQITHVRLVDVVGSIDSAYTTYDIEGNKINDPWPTPFPSSGFDLDAVGVLHAVGITAMDDVAADKFSVYPNPVSAGALLQLALTGDVNVYNTQGAIVKQFSNTNNVAVSDLTAGCYIVELIKGNQTFRQKLFVTQ